MDETTNKELNFYRRMIANLDESSPRAVAISNIQLAELIKRIDSAEEAMCHVLAVLREMDVGDAIGRDGEYISTILRNPISMLSEYLESKEEK